MELDSDAPSLSSGSTDQSTELEPISEVFVECHRFSGGGRDRDKSQSGYPQWFRAFLTGLCLAVCLVFLGTLASLPFREDHRGLLVAAVIVDEYRVAGLPPALFSAQDSERLLKLSSSPSDTRTAQQAAGVDDFADFFQKQLSGADQRVRVLYVRAHSCSGKDYGTDPSDLETGNGENDADDTKPLTAWLIPAYAVPRRRSQGYTVDQMLDALEQGTARNIAVLLDVSELQQRLTAGILENHYVKRLNDSFEARTKLWNDEQSLPGERMNGRRLLIVTSASDGQASWASPKMQGTPFAVAATYCLSGGINADLRGPRGGPDGIVMAREMFEFVRGATHAWSRENRTEQVPQLLSWPSSESDSDFMVAAVNPAVTIQAIIDPPPEETGVATKLLAIANSELAASEDETDEGEKADERDNTAPEGEVALQASPAPESSNNGSRTDRKTGEEQRKNPHHSGTDSIQRIADLWTRTRQLRDRRIWSTRPILWAKLQQSLNSLQWAILADQQDAIRELLDQAIPSLLGQLGGNGSIQTTEPEASDLPTNQTHAMTRIDKTRTITPESHRDTHQQITTAEATRQTDASSIYTPQTGTESPLVADTQIILAEYAARTDDHTLGNAIKLAEQLTLDSDVSVEVSLVLADEYAAIQDEYRQALTELLGGHADVGRNSIAIALSKAEALRMRSVLLDEQLDEVQHLLLTLPSLLNVKNRRLVREVLPLVKKYTELIPVFAIQPDPRLLEELHRLTIQIRESLNHACRASLDPINWRDALEMIEIPGLDPAMRTRILTGLLNIDDVLQFRQATSTNSDIAQPTREFEVNDELETAALSTESRQLLNAYCDMTVALYRESDAGPDTNMVTSNNNRKSAGAGVNKGPSARESDAIEKLQSGWFNAFSTATPEGDAPTVRITWSRRLLSLGLAWWSAQAPGRPERQDRYTERLAVAFRESLFEHERRRIMRDIAALPEGSCANSIEAWQRSGNSLVNTASVRPRFVTMISPATLNFVVGEKTVHNFHIRATESLPPGTTLIFDWNASQLAENLVLKIVPSTIKLDTDAATDESGRISWPLESPDALRGREYLFGIEGELLSAEGEPFTVLEKFRHIISSLRIRLPDGRTQWLPLRIMISPKHIRPAELLVKWTNLEKESGSLDILPNQEVELQLLVKRNDPDIHNLRIELVGSGRPVELDLRSWEPGTGERQVESPESLALTFDGPGLRIRLYSGDKLLDQQNLDVHVLNLKQCFHDRAIFDPTSRALTVEFQRRQRSDSPAPVNFEIDQLRQLVSAANAAGFENGSQTATLDEDDESVVLRVTVPVATRLPVSVAVSVCGVPRQFRYSVHDDGKLVRPDERTLLQFLNPTGSANWLRSNRFLEASVELRVDAPGIHELRLGVDLNNDGVLSEGELQARRELSDGRQSTLSLKVHSGQFVVAAETGAIRQPINLTGLRGAQKLLAELKSRSTEAGSDSTRGFARIYLLDSAPPVSILRPAADANLVASQPLLITLQGDETFDAVDHVEIARDVNGNGVIDDPDLRKRVPVSQLIPSGTGAWSLELPSEFSAAGQAVFLVRTEANVTDPAISALPPKIDNAPQQVEEPSPAPIRLELAPVSLRLTFAAAGSVSGTVQTSDGVPISGAYVTITNGIMTRTDKAGRYEFTDILPGIRVVTVQSRGRVGHTQVRVLAARKNIANVTLFVR